MNMPDNLTVTPWGDLMVCEDNQRDAYLRLVTRTGQVLPFAHNVVSASELAGVITYTRNSWGNKTGEAIQPAEVKAARK